METSAAGATTIHVDVKWQKELFPKVEIDTTQPPLTFKLQLFSLTGVPPERQKIMGFKGGLLKDDADWKAIGATSGTKVTMLGTAERAPEPPKVQTTFVEDLPEEQQDTTGGLSRYGAGLENMGNTCYMNSTVQCLYAVPELRSRLASTFGASTATSLLQASPSGNSPEAQLASAMRMLFQNMEKSGQPVMPMEFILILRRAFPQFDQRGRDGLHMQQDAEECWGALLTALKNAFGRSADTQKSVVQDLFGIQTRATLKCDESDETLDVSSVVFVNFPSRLSFFLLCDNHGSAIMQLDEVELLLKCNINSEVNHLMEGLRLGLQGDREKTSTVLGRLSVFRGQAVIQTLPPYLTVQMMRFFYKADVQQKAKILRKVNFPLTLDIFELCSDQLKARLDGPRLAYREAEDARLALEKDKKKQKLENENDADQSEAKKDTPLGDETKGQYHGELTGRYDLIGVLTHKGRSADSGHYVSWVKQDDGQWIQFDDDNMIPRKEEDVLALSGGGDWHMAYILLYKAQRVP